jgi:hypothetical protein
MHELQETIASIDRRLLVVVQLLAYQITQGKKLAEAAPILKRLGLTNVEIGEVFNSPANVVRARLTEKKKAKSATN